MIAPKSNPQMAPKTAREATSTLKFDFVKSILRLLMIGLINGALIPTQPAVNICPGSQGPTPPVIKAETIKVKAPIKKPKLHPKTYPTIIIKKKIGLNPPGPGMAVSRKRNDELIATSIPMKAMIQVFTLCVWIS